MPNRLVRPELRNNPEFQSCLVRFGIWLFALGYIGIGGLVGYYQVEFDYYLSFFAGYLVVFIGLLVSVTRRADWEARRYFSVVVDVTATSLAIILTNEAISPFYLLYIWVFISYGARYDSPGLLKAAAGCSLLAYAIVVIAMDAWRAHTFEAFVFLLMLTILPLYQYGLLRRLHEARAEAERSDRAKGDFLATMTHELRTPLAGIVGMTGLLKTSGLTSEQREYVGAISVSASHLDALINDVLDVSRIEFGKIRLERAFFDPGRAAGAVCSSLAKRALDKGVELVCHVDSRLPPVMGDELRLRQVLFNLVGNAIKFTERGEVVLVLRMQPADRDLNRPHLYLEVKDTGVGIPKKYQEAVFDRFWQADASTTRHHGGTGLGTTIARDLTLLMGGRIGLESKPGEGSTFWVKLPLFEAGSTPREYPAPPRKLTAMVMEGNESSLLAIMDACNARGIGCLPVRRVVDIPFVETNGRNSVDLVIIADSPKGIDLKRVGALFRERLEREDLPLVYLRYTGRPAVGDESICGEVNKPFTPDQLGEVIAQVQRGEEKARLKARSEWEKGVAGQDVKGRILVAEDNEINAKVLHTLLTDAGYEVTLVKNGEEALEQAKRSSFDLAFVDLHMPRLDGLGFTRRFRGGVGRNRTMPIVALTVAAAEEGREECLNAGMDGFLTKPVEACLLFALIRRLTNRVAVDLPRRGKNGG